MIVHGSSLSPFVRKVLLYAHEKELAVENRFVLLGAKSPEFLMMSPCGKIPAFEDGEYKLSDSSAIIAYLEALHPDPPLIPAEPRARGRVAWFDEFADTIMFQHFVPIFFNRVVAPLTGSEGDEAAAAKAEAELVPRTMAYLEGQLEGADYLVGDGFTLADLAVAGPFINLRLAGVTPDAVRYPRTCAYLTRIHARPSFVEAIARDEAFLASRR